jgi:hypothetical protein
MDVAATSTLEKVGFWHLFETTNARFPVHFAATVRTRTGSEFDMRGVLHNWIRTNRAFGSNGSSPILMRMFHQQRVSLPDFRIFDYHVTV